MEEDVVSTIEAKGGGLPFSFAEKDDDDDDDDALSVAAASSSANGAVAAAAATVGALGNNL